MFTNPVPPTRFKRPPRPENRRHWCPKCCSSTCILTKYQTDIYEIHYDHAGVWKYQAHLKDEDRYTKYQGDFLWSVKLKAYLGERKLYRKAVKLEKKKSKLIGLARQIKVKPTPIPDEEYDGWSDY